MRQCAPRAHHPPAPLALWQIRATNPTPPRTLGHQRRAAEWLAIFKPIFLASREREGMARQRTDGSRRAEQPKAFVASAEDYVDADARERRGVQSVREQRRDVPPRNASAENIGRWLERRSAVAWIVLGAPHGERWTQAAGKRTLWE